MKLFLDTNVLVDFILERGDSYPQILEILSCVLEGTIEACVSSLTVVNADFICVERNRTTRDEYMMKIKVLKPFVSLSSIEASDVYSSYDSNWNDFEDGVQYFSAKRAGCDYIVTRNEKDFELSDIPVVNPDKMTEILYGLLQNGIKA